MRSKLLCLLPLLFLGLFAWGCLQNEPAPGEGEPAWSVQMHVHGSFSEGLGSIDSHSHEATQLGVDVIWWSDHDFRISSYKHVSRFGFEGPAEPLDAGEDWKLRLPRHAREEKTISMTSGEQWAMPRFVLDPVRSGERSLVLEAKGDEDRFQNQACMLETVRKVHRRSLAGGLVLKLAVHPNRINEDARPFVRVLLSEHAPREGLGLSQYSLRYFLSNDELEPYREGTTYHIPLPGMVDAWNDLNLAISEDAEKGFPLIPARDNALYRIVMGVEARRGAEIEAAFDALHIDASVSGLDMFALQRELIAEVGGLYPNLVQHQGLEISYASRHLNEFSLQAELIDYDELGKQLKLDPLTGLYDGGAFRRVATRKAVDDAHARGGLISYNHLFGVGMEDTQMGRTRETLLEVMLANRAFGVDILEVGYRDRGGANLADHLWVWDQMALAGLRLVGTGVSDSHGGPDERWSGRPNNFVSWIYAPDRSKPALLEGLRRGRLYFGDIELFDGRIDLLSARGWQMGQEVLTDRGEINLQVHVSGARSGDRLLVIDGAEEVMRVELSKQSQDLNYRRKLGPEESSFVRVELQDSQGQAKAISNPIYFVRPKSLEAPGKIASARLGIDLLGLCSKSVEGFALEAAELLPGGGLLLRGALELGSSEAGISLELGEFGEPGGVRFGGGLSGEWQVTEGELRLRIQGARGELTILPPGAE